ncbi:carboxylesterase/lipase family protein [Spirosoma arcticum]
MKKQLSLFLISVLATVGMIAFISCPNDLGVVKIKTGLIAGTRSKSGAVHIFRGIPFAAPPVGDLRWRSPQPVASWTGVRTCDTFGPSPMQRSPSAFGPWSAEFLIPQRPISEDCLYLNVWTGAKSDREKRPVLVWIYGGGFSSGGSSVPIYDGEAVASKGVIFVSINYRVGPFGFFAHPELSQESGESTAPAGTPERDRPVRNASGNYGLMDQIAALQWVNQNIAYFGGDPTNVTIAGQSAGSMSVNCLVASPVAKNLFKRAIAQSGANFTNPPITLRQAEEAGLKLAQSAGASSLRELRAKPAEEILQKMPGQFPIVDGYVLPQSVADIFRAGKQNEVTLLTGWNEDEGMLRGPLKNAGTYRTAIDRQYGADAQTVLRFYPGGTDEEAASSQVKMSRDMTFGLQNYIWADIQSQQGKNVYVYRFTRKVPATGEYAQYGAFHTGEVAYAYDNLQFIDHRLRPLESVDTELARNMSSYWINFAKSGDPNGQQLPQWPAYSGKDKQVMVFDTRIAAKRLPDGAALDFLRTIPSKR